MAAEAVAKTPAVGSESGDDFAVGEEKQSSKVEEPEEPSDNVEPYLVKFEQELCQGWCKL